MKKMYAVPEFLTSNDIKRVRSLLNMTQKEFADLLELQKEQ